MLHLKRTLENLPAKGNRIRMVTDQRREDLCVSGG
jgi:hypothetical protein